MDIVASVVATVTTMLARNVSGEKLLHVWLYSVLEFVINS